MKRSTENAIEREHIASRIARDKKAMTLCKKQFPECPTEANYEVEPCMTCPFNVKNSKRDKL